MAWKVEVQDNALGQLSRLSTQDTRRILDFLKNRLATYESPRQIGEALKGKRLGEYWRYRVGDYRLLCEIKDDRLIVLVLEVGNRRDIYR